MAELREETSDSHESYLSLVKRIKYFQSLSEKIIAKKPLDELLDEIIFSSKRLIGAESSSLLLFDDETKYLYFHIATGEKGKSIESKFIKLGKGIAGWVAENKKAIKIDDCYTDERFSAEFDKLSGYTTRNMLCAPMIRKGELLGVMQVMNKENKGDFNDLDLDFFKALASQCAIAIENARLINVEIKSEQLKYELDTARSIQENLLPKQLPNFEDIDIDAKLIPAKEVGGDYYNIIRLSKTHTLIFIADVTGKSVPAALIVSTIYSFIQTYMIINPDKFNLISFVESLNKFLITSTTSDKFATAWFGLFDHERCELESINAGHNPIYVYLSDSCKIQELSDGGLFLGSLDMPYSSEVIKPAHDDCIVFYTDGITEALNLKQEEYGEDNFKSVIKSNAKKTSSEVLKIIIDDVTNFKGSAEQSDDITCGVLKF